MKKGFFFFFYGKSFLGGKPTKWNAFVGVSGEADKILGGQKKFLKPGKNSHPLKKGPPPKPTI